MPQDAINLNQKSRSHRFGWSLRLSHELRLLRLSLLGLRNSGCTGAQLPPPTLVTAKDDRTSTLSKSFAERARTKSTSVFEGFQQEATRLTSELRGKGGRRLSVGRREADTQWDHEGGEEGGMSMVGMRGQLSAMQDEIAYLREQRRSAWAQGLPDDLPPGYTLTPPSISSGPTVVPPN